MELRTQAGLKTIGFFVCRSGSCPDCETLFNDKMEVPRGDLRYCPRCKQHKLGNIKSQDRITEKHGT